MPDPRQITEQNMFTEGEDKNNSKMILDIEEGSIEDDAHRMKRKMQKKKYNKGHKGTSEDADN